MCGDDLSAICDLIEPLPTADADQLPDGVRCRIIKGDRKGRTFCTPRNPGPPTLTEFNPRIGVLAAGEVAGKVASRMHGIFPAQADSVRQMSVEELLRSRPDDPISGHAEPGGFTITGGHHRLHEIDRRVQAGELPPETLVRILFHD